MCRGWWIGGLVLAFLVAALPAVVRAADAEKVDPAAVEQARKQIRDELRKPKPDYHEIEKPLEELLKAAREHEAGALPADTATEAELREKMAKAVDDGQFDLASYYMERLKLIENKPNPFGGWLDLTVWTIVVFLLLLFVLGKFAWTPMLQGLQKRENDIKAAVDDARAAREEATRLREEVQAERRNIEDMRREIIQKAQADAQRTAEEIMAKVKADAQTERDRARREVETERAQTWQALMQQTADLAVMMTTKAIGRQLTPDDHKRFVDEALVDIRQAGNGQPTSASV